MGEDDALGLDRVCQRGGERHRIEARNAELISPLPEGHLYLAAYLAWNGRCRMFPGGGGSRQRFWEVRHGHASHVEPE